MQAIYMMLVAAFLWSLYPILIALSDGAIGAAVFVLVVHLSCGISAALFAWLSIKQKMVVWKNLITMTRSLNWDQWMYLSLIGLVSTLYNFCFVLSMSMTSKMGAAIVIESWPLFAMFLAPLLVTKNWTELSLTDYLKGIMAMAGVFMIMLGDKNGVSLIFTDFQTFIDSQDFIAILGILVALVGSVSLALSIVLSAEISNRVSKIALQQSEPGLDCAFIGEVIRRVIALPPTLFLLFMFFDDLSVTWEGLAYSAFSGVFIFCVGSMLLTMALLKSSSSTINMLCYLSPVLAVVWLYLLGMGELTPMIIIGGALVVSSNLLVIEKNTNPKEKTP